MVQRDYPDVEEMFEREDWQKIDRVKDVLKRIKKW